MRTLIATAPVALLVLVLGVGPAVAQTPYEDPSFVCGVVHEFGEGEAPELDDLPDDDPLCVVYAKEEITVSDGGAVAFLLGEPARVAAALPACQYWQRDTWSIQLAPDTPALIRWDGSYWYDRGAGVGGARMTQLEIGGQPASPSEAADLLEPLSSDLADAFREYGDETGGGGVAFDLGGGDPTCVAAGEPGPAPRPDEDDGTGSPADEAPEAPGAPTPPPGQDPTETGDQLPVTGAVPALLGLALLGAAAALRRR